ncbi:MAG: prepilin-type N-terminal cleavage/methylation domain-containing protein [Patescibacteria group bacterium]|nr:prepilin-type N-terminal cleavage/methylation domain-containing protein [Patescibacteria group bacterium]
MNYKKFLNHQQGLSLIEIMVALTILTIAFIGLMQAFPYGLSINKATEDITVASYLAQDKIEELHSLGYDNIATGTPETKHRLSDDQANYLYFYQRQTEVNYVDGNLSNSILDTGMKKISVTVYYTNALSKTEKSYNITTLISER